LPLASHLLISSLSSPFFHPLLSPSLLSLYSSGWAWPPQCYSCPLLPLSAPPTHTHTHAYIRIRTQRHTHIQTLRKHTRHKHTWLGRHFCLGEAWRPVRGKRQIFGHCSNALNPFGHHTLLKVFSHRSNPSLPFFNSSWKYSVTALTLH
jgi:hypothetical protein